MRRGFHVSWWASHVFNQSPFLNCKIGTTGTFVPCNLSQSQSPKPALPKSKTEVHFNSANVQPRTSSVQSPSAALFRERISSSPLTACMLNYIVYYERCVRCARTSYYVEYDVVLYPLCEVGFPAVCFTRTSATSLRNRKLRFKTSCLRTHV